MVTVLQKLAKCTNFTREKESWWGAEVPECSAAESVWTRDGEEANWSRVEGDV